ncbi:MAG TPA: hypothetical protein VLM85_28490 [Polyangiaceae bacterium]|nr:hypothetical protein [Polyangiaceae bacterium]
MTLPAKIAIALGHWGAPPELFAWLVLAFGAVCVLGALSGRFDPFDGVMRTSRARFLAGASLAAAFLTIAYVAHYLRGGPRIIDATTYWLQARALSHGQVAWHVPFPSASFRGRFLLFDPPDRLAGIFPPGWPLLLSSGFVLGTPLLVGIALSAALTLATYGLAREALHDRDEATREHAARVAVLLSLACATLRYHTADPMSHAASALGITVALVFALRAARAKERTARDLLVAGLCVGLVGATRPVSALPIAAIALYATRRVPWRARARFALGLLPGVALLLWAQYAATGSLFESTQRSYYAVSDGPPGCFRYGFGKGIGCLYEHGDFVRARLAGGYGLLATLGTTVRRLHMHLSDALDAWPVLLLALAPWARLARTQSWARLATALVALQVLAYAPFYFDGDYPGGGARLFADVLPVEHVLLAVAVVQWPAPKLAGAAWRKAAALVGLVLAGFALHGAFDHLALADRDGGKPMFEPERLQDAHVEAGLLFVDTDHGFDLAYDPAVTDPLRGLVVARLHNDSHDRLLYDSLGHPPTWAYRFGHGDPTLLPFSPMSATDGAGRERWRFEAEAEWPPLGQDGAWAEPVWASGSCASGGQVLTVHPAPRGSVTIAVPIPRDGWFAIKPHTFMPIGEGPVEVTLRQGATNLQWSAPATEGCSTLAAQDGELQKGEATLELAVNGTDASLDWVEVQPAVGH